jgi:hypothetical protein
MKEAGYFSEALIPSCHIPEDCVLKFLSSFDISKLITDKTIIDLRLNANIFTALWNSPELCYME